MHTKQELLTHPIQHFDIKQHNVVALVDAMEHMAFSSRDLNRAASIYERMLRDKDCGVILCLAGSLISAWLTEIIGRTDRSIFARLAPITASSLMAPEFQTMQQRNTGAQTPPIIPLATVDYLPFVP